MLKLRLLDLFCSAGGCSRGYASAGFEVVGVDIRSQPNYPYEFHCADALTFPLEGFDAIHASPPCQSFSRIQSLARARNGGQYPEYPNLIADVRQMLVASGLPYVIENVSGAKAHMICPIMLCGSMFGLKVYRHRLFETSFPIVPPPHFPHRDSTPSAGNGLSPKGFVSVCGTGGVRGMNSSEILDCWRNAMGIDWMTRHELAEAIPPSYTEWIGKIMLDKPGRNC